MAAMKAPGESLGLLLSKAMVLFNGKIYRIISAENDREIDSLHFQS